ncbi:MAG TPA: acyl-CoA dehydrogenase [Devosiaceae bacterium]
MTTAVDDILFTLAAVCAPFPHEPWAAGGAADALRAFAEFTEDAVAPTNAVSDRTGCSLAGGRVSMPAPLVDLYAKYVELGWHKLALPEEHGGIGAPEPVVAAATELLCAANHAFQIVVGLVPGSARAIVASATGEQAARLLADYVSGEALATMCLTEAGAGSDLSAIRTTARADGNGKWRISGEKIFITGGDQNLSNRILHLVLARTGTPQEGTRGLSLFACSSHLPDGSRNAVKVLRNEEKLGIHAAPTCQLAFEGAEAEIVGAPGEGLKAMFVMMNHARLEVAMQGVAHAGEAHRRAAAYAATRTQGGRAIADHGDVRAMLLEMDALALGSRAMALHAAETLDTNPAFVEFATPVVKAFCTDAGSRAADLGIQVLGGYGYLPEYGLEQIWRDCRITRLYEGTNGIMAMTLARRLLGGADGAYVGAFIEEMGRIARDAAGEGAVTFGEVLGAWEEARDAVLGAEDPGIAATPFLRLTGLLYFAAMWLRLEAAANRAADPDRIRATAQYVRAAMLPQCQTLAETCIRLLNPRTDGRLA